MFIPVGVDGIIRHKPYATAGIVIANYLVALCIGVVDPFFPLFSGNSTLLDSLILDYGEWNPVTWVTSAFVHGDIAHLCFNMIFLIAVGMIVEGLIGWRRLLALYLGIALASGALEELLFSSGGSYGASSCIYGLMVAAALWAPRTRVNIIYMVLPYAGSAVVSIAGVMAWKVGWQVAYATFTTHTLSSEMLHLVGAAVGFGAALLFLKKGWVDTENEDWLGLRAEARRASRELRDAPSSLPPVQRKPVDLGYDLVDLGLLFAGCAAIALAIFMANWMLFDFTNHTAAALLGLGSIALVGLGFFLLRYRALR